MKYLIYFLALIICTTCQNDKEIIKSQMNEDTLANENIILKVIPSKFRNDLMADLKIIYTIKNRSLYSIQYGTRYKIERYTDNHWEKVSFVENIVFEDVMYGLEPGESQDFKMYIPKILKNKTINPGRHRIVKVVSPVNRKKEKDTLTAVFTVE